MKPALILAAALLAGSLARAQDVARTAHMLSLSCIEALVSIDQAGLAGVFSFVPEKDGPAAFADLIVHNKSAFKKYLAKVEKDYKTAGGVVGWDHDVLQFAMTIYGSPLGETVDKPSGKVMDRLLVLTQATKLSLEEMTARRKG